MTQIFGARWDAPMCDGAAEVPTPVGQLCLECREPIEAGDRGVVMPVLVTPDSELIGMYQLQEIHGKGYGVVIAPAHLECYLRSTLAHLYQQCHCYVQHESVRAEALATLAAINAQREAEGYGPL